MRLCFFVGVVGFEPTTPWSQTRCANRTALHPEIALNALLFCSGEGGIRTRGTALPVRRFSKPVVSATHPPHLFFLSVSYSIK